jgi:hypothetical protein
LKCVDIKFGGVVGLENVDFLENTQIISKFNSSLGYNKELDIREGAFSVSYDRSQEDKKKTGKGLPDGFDKNGHVIPEIFDDGSISDFINVNELDISNFKNLKNLEGLKNITNIMQLNLANCIELKYLKGLEKMLDLREIDLTGCTSLESLHALKNCTKLEKIITLKCDNLKPKPKLKKMDTIEKVQEHLSQL